MTMVGRPTLRVCLANPPHIRPQASKSQRPASAPCAQSSEPCTQQFEPRPQSKMPCGFRPLASTARLRESPARKIAPAPASKGPSAKLRASRAEPRRLARKQKRSEGGVPQAKRRVPSLARRAECLNIGLPQTAYLFGVEWRSWPTSVDSASPLPLWRPKGVQG